MILKIDDDDVENIIDNIHDLREKICVCLRFRK